MFNKFFGKKPPEAQESRLPEERLRSIEGSTSADLAAEMLTAPSALMQLTNEDARIVVTYMKPHKIAEGVTFIKEGDTEDTDFMLLLLDGEVMIESIVVSRTEPITVSVLGPGSCTAVSTVRCAILTRDALNQLLNDDPRTAAKLMMAVSLRIAERMRESADKLKLYAQLTQAMQEEINNLMPL